MEKLCEECEGIGSYEHLSCSKPSSLCCGGCTIIIDCPECNGTGEVPKMFGLSELK